jgi:hypothetical protein
MTGAVNIRRAAGTLLESGVHYLSAPLLRPNARQFLNLDALRDGNGTTLRLRWRQPSERVGPDQLGILSLYLGAVHQSRKRPDLAALAISVR